MKLDRMSIRLSGTRATTSALLASAVLATGCGGADLGLASGPTCEDFKTLATSEQDDIAREKIEDGGLEVTSFSVGLVRTSLQAFCSNPSNSTAKVSDVSLPLGGQQ